MGFNSGFKGLTAATSARQFKTVLIKFKERNVKYKT